MKKQTPCCALCSFNDHGQEDRIPFMETYLGKIIQVYEETRWGGPMLNCHHSDDGKVNFIIWIAGDSRFEGEFERQLSGFPKRCPLRDAK